MVKNKTILNLIHNFVELHAMDMLRIALAIVFIWFGLLKIFWLSPANALITETVFWFDSSWFIPLLGIWEIIIGIFFLVPKLTRYVLWIMLPQMFGTFLPLVILFEKAFHGNILAPTMEGQYIIKNLVLISGALVVVVYTNVNNGAYACSKSNSNKNSNQNMNSNLNKNLKNIKDQAKSASRDKRASAKARTRR